MFKILTDKTQTIILNILFLFLGILILWQIQFIQGIFL